MVSLLPSLPPSLPRPPLTPQSRSFPVDRADLQSLVSRAGDAVSPLLDRLYEKALQSHEAVFDPTVSKYDLGFRIQSALRMLRWVVM